LEDDDRGDDTKKTTKSGFAELLKAEISKFAGEVRRVLFA
jgi:hypothetical protein